MLVKVETVKHTLAVCLQSLQTGTLFVPQAGFWELHLRAIPGEAVPRVMCVAVTRVEAASVPNSRASV